MATEQKVERVVVGQQVYFQQQQKGWIRGVVKAVPEGSGKVQVEDAASGNVETIPITRVHGYIPQAFDAENPDLFHLNDLHVAPALHCIKQRFEELHLQYSLLGEVVLSVNPFQPMPFNTDKNREKYLTSPNQRLLPPHVWQVAHRAYVQIIVRGLRNQSVVISGESGSGKTETTKMLVGYLGQMSHQRSGNPMQRRVADKVSDSLEWSNPVLESFGNARTLRNHNSSRFGKYIKLYFDSVSGVMVGGKVSTYLLEKSRIVRQGSGERNYHIFYEMLAGLSPEEKAELGGLKTSADYKCLRVGNTFDRRGVDGETLNDAEEFSKVRKALTNLGIANNTSRSMFKILAAILHLLELEFTSDQNDKAYIVDEGPFLTACGLLQVDPKLLRECFLVKSSTSIVTIHANKREAEGFCGAFCKAIYVGLFDRLVKLVNASIAPQESTNECKYIGLLDIFGFENFSTNGFEQLCINYANDVLQNHYNKYTFLNDEAECKSEGVSIPEVAFPDNTECIGMFEQKRFGIFALLDNECNYKAGTSERFTQNVWDHWRTLNTFFVLPKSTVPNQFGVRHYASFVNYTTGDWLEKNTDGIKHEVYQTVSNSADAFIRSLFSDGPVLNDRKHTVGLRFQNQLTALREELELTETQFVRCIKPNMSASPHLFENVLVSNQLESTSLLQTIKLKRQGYPVRRSIHDFCRYFFLIMPRSPAELYKRHCIEEAAKTMLAVYQKLYDWATPNFAVGRTKVFLRAEVWASLERLLLRRKGCLLRRCVPLLRRWVYVYRESKRRVEERRQAELKLEREEQARRVAQMSVNATNRELMDWIEELSALFPSIGVVTIRDVVLFLPKREESLKALLEMQRQRFDGSLRLSFTRVMDEAGMRQQIIEKFLRNGINTLYRLAGCDEMVLRGYGVTETELASVRRHLLKEESARVRLDRLRDSIGVTQLSAILLEAKHSAHAAADYTTKIRDLMDLGFPRSHVVPVLTHYSGDVEKAAARLLREDVGERLREKPPKGEKGRWTSFDAEVQQLVKLGVSKEKAKNALRSTNGSVDEAARSLFNNVT